MLEVLKNQKEMNKPQKARSNPTVTAPRRPHLQLLKDLMPNHQATNHQLAQTHQERKLAIREKESMPMEDQETSTTHQARSSEA